MSESNPTLGLALGGGGSRAFVHLGVLCALQEEGIPPGAISGSSMGAVLGAMYALEPDAEAVREKAIDYFSRSRYFGLHPRPSKGDGLLVHPGLWARIRKFFWTMSLATTLASCRGLFWRNAVHTAVDALLPDTTIESLTLPFCCNALNMTDGELTVFTHGSLPDAVKAGTAVGILYAPYCCNAVEYADAAPLASVPAQACRALGVDVVLAVDIRSPKPKPFTIINGFDILQRVEMIQSSALNDAECAAADLVIRPDTEGLFWGDFTKLDRAVEAGRQAMQEAMPALRAALTRAKTPSTPPA